MALNNLKNVISKATRFTTYSSTLLDPILVSSFVNVLHSDTIEENISDHKATEILPKFINVPKSCSKRKVWYYERADFVQLNNLIENYNWDFITTSDINLGCEKFLEIFLNLSSQCIPSKEITIRPTDKPWHNSEIRRCSRQRYRQKNIAVRPRRNSNWERFKHLRNRVNNLKKVAKERCFSHLDESLSQYRFENPSKYWKHLRNLINMNKKIESMPILETVEKNIEEFHYNDEDKAECLNKYFASISTVDESSASLPQFVLKTNGEMNEVLISTTDVEGITHSLDINKAVGLDQISHR